MAITVTNRIDGVTADGRRFVEATLQFPPSYVQGDSFTALTTLGIKEVREVFLLVGKETTWRAHPLRTVPTATTSGRGFVVDTANPLVPVFRLYTGVSTEAAAASDQSAFRFRARFVGA